MLCAELMVQQSSAAPVWIVWQVCGRQRLSVVPLNSVSLVQSTVRSLMEASVFSAMDCARAIEWHVSPALVVYCLPERQVLFDPSTVPGKMSWGGGFGAVAALTLHSTNTANALAARQSGIR